MQQPPQLARLGRHRDVPTRCAGGQPQRFDEAAQQLHDVLTRLVANALVDEQRVQLSAAREVITDAARRTDQRREQIGTQRALHDQQRIKPPSAQAPAQFAHRGPAAALVKTDELHAFYVTQQALLGLADDPSDLRTRQLLLQVAQHGHHVDHIAQ